jgi:hypothetical protein
VLLLAEATQANSGCRQWPATRNPQRECEGLAQWHRRCASSASADR